MPSGRAVRLVRTKAELAQARAALPGRVAVVPTMGALHDGHRALIKRAKEIADSVIVTVFVNPLQFRPGEDLDQYPRTLDADVAMCEAEGVDLVFAPSEREIYPDGREDVTKVHPREHGEVLEGASRPGFFTGVLTVVAKLFNLTRPDVACFGAKDFQQQAMVRRMVGDLDFPVAIETVPTVREPDGLALSSRNAYLSAAERRTALAVPRAIRAAQAAAVALAEEGVSEHVDRAERVRGAALAVLEAEPGVEVDYVDVRSDLLSIPFAEADAARILIAVKVGNTRLIDNAPVVIQKGWTPDV
ncbi:pantoate--beta-alanine ligase [Glycomyces albidus]|uniref:pantoate--beta-alanine ligase n=1 Tax=Glycomyces albidus TaxID=2656774 RepID=UPI003898EC3F